MHQNDLRRFDLNLLAVFDALMAERHTGRAGERLGLTQPAVSHALGRLRALAGDPLFVKQARGMTPTPRAEALATVVGPALAALRGSLGVTHDFDPATSTRSFVLGASDYAALTLLPGLIARLRQVAPGIDLRMRPVTPADVGQAMRRRQIDLAIGPLSASPGPVIATPLFSERLVLVARRGHPDLTRPLDARRFAELPHLLVTPQGDGTGSVDERLREQGLTRRIVLTLAHFGAAPGVIAASDLVAMLPERVARGLGLAAAIEIHDSPLDLPPWVVGVVQPQESGADTGLRWLVAQLAASAD